MQAKDKKKDEAVEVVKRKLWSHGYSVKRAFADTYDLLVEGKWRVAVERRAPGISHEGWGLYDVLAVVEYPKMGKPVVGYVVEGGEVSTSPVGVFINSTGKVHGKKEKGDA